MQYAQMQELFQLGIVTKEDMLEASTIQNKHTITENAKKMAEQQAQAAQQQSEIQMRELEARIQATQATAGANRGLEAERTSRVLENVGIAQERQADARKADAQADLDHIKALKEIQSIDIGHLRELVEIAKMLREDKEAAELAKAQKMQQDLQQLQPQQPLPQQQAPQWLRSWKKKNVVVKGVNGMLRKKGLRI